MRKLFEVKVDYTDGTDEMLLLDGKDYKDAEAEAEAWVDFKKTVKTIEALGEVQRGRQNVDKRR